MRYLLLAIFLFPEIVAAQRFKSESGTITFFSEAAIEDISATNQKATSLFNVETGEIAFLVSIVDFEFEKSLMQQHFNEKYMESDKFPKATFKGTIQGVDRTKSGLQKASASGILTIHGESRNVNNITGTVEVGPNSIVLQSSFMVALDDYKIKIPRLLWQNIAESVEVTISFNYKPI